MYLVWLSQWAKIFPQNNTSWHVSITKKQCASWVRRLNLCHADTMHVSVYDEWQEMWKGEFWVRLKHSLDCCFGILKSRNVPDNTSNSPEMESRTVRCQMQYSGAIVHKVTDRPWCRVSGMWSAPWLKIERSFTAFRFRVVVPCILVWIMK